MNSRCVALALLSVISFVSQANGADVFLQTSPVPIIAGSTPYIFPVSWQVGPVWARCDALHVGERTRTRRVLDRAVSKYPRRVLQPHLSTVYVMHRLSYSGVTAAGTNSRTNVYPANRGPAAGYTDAWIEMTFHAEFSSILLRNNPYCLDTTAWQRQNGPYFRYGVSGVDAIKHKKAGTRFDESLHEKGFLYQYATSTLENDFNTIASQLFLGDEQFWDVVRKYPRVRAKVVLAIDFYRRIDPTMNVSFFHSQIPGYSRRGSR